MGFIALNVHTLEFDVLATATNYIFQIMTTGMLCYSKLTNITTENGSMENNKYQRYAVQCGGNF